MMQAFAVRLRGSNHETTINSTSPGRAKLEYLNRLDMAEVKFTDVRCRRLGGPVTDSNLIRTANYRGVPFVRAGMRVMVGDIPGRIVGSNSSANFDVLFDGGTKWEGEVLNCHPNHEIAYFEDDGTILADFRKSQEPGLEVQ